MINLLILAAGMGSRFGGIKQIKGLGPNDELIIDFSIYDAKKVGVEKIYFLIRKEIESQFKELITRKYNNNLNYEFIYQDLAYGLDETSFLKNRVKPWGTAHALLCAEPYLKNKSFMVINADDFYGYSAFKSCYDFLCSNKNDFGLISYELGNTISEYGEVSRGVIQTDSNSYLKSIIELKKIYKKNNNILSENSNIKLANNTLVSMNFWGFNKNIFSNLKQLFNENLNKAKDTSSFEYYIPLYIDQIKKDHKIKVIKSKDAWFGVTYKEDANIVKNKISDLINKKVYPSNIYA
jgi:NDP-sugar pyrophosphorylase family protein